MEWVYSGFKFSRTGIFGNGDRINVYDSGGEKVDVIYLSEDDKFSLSQKCSGESAVHCICQHWYCKNNDW